MLTDPGSNKRKKNYQFKTIRHDACIRDRLVIELKLTCDKAVRKKAEFCRPACKAPSNGKQEAVNPTKSISRSQITLND